MQFHLCDTCAATTMNADLSTFEADSDEYARVLAFIESAGYLCIVGEYDNGGYWSCDCCDEATIGSGTTLAPLDDSDASDSTGDSDSSSSDSTSDGAHWTDEQADGWACTRCAEPFGPGSTSVPDGSGPRGQVFRCYPSCGA